MPRAIVYPRFSTNTWAETRRCSEKKANSAFIASAMDSHWTGSPSFVTARGSAPPVGWPWHNVLTVLTACGHCTSRRLSAPARFHMASMSISAMSNVGRFRQIVLNSIYTVSSSAKTMRCCGCLLGLRAVVGLAVCLSLACFHHCVLAPRWRRSMQALGRARDEWHDYEDVVPRLKEAKVSAQARPRRADRRKSFCVRGEGV